MCISYIAFPYMVIGWLVGNSALFNRQSWFGIWRVLILDSDVWENYFLVLFRAPAVHLFVGCHALLGSVVMCICNHTYCTKRIGIIISKAYSFTEPGACSTRTSSPLEIRCWRTKESIWGCMLPLKDRRSVSSRSHKFCFRSITGNLFLWTRELPRFAGSVLTVYHSVWGPVCSTGRGYVSLGRACLTVSYEPSCELWTEIEPKNWIAGFMYVNQIFSVLDAFSFLKNIN